MLTRGATEVREKKQTIQIVIGAGACSGNAGRRCVGIKAVTPAILSCFHSFPSLLPGKCPDSFPKVLLISHLTILAVQQPKMLVACYSSRRSGSDPRSARVGLVVDMVTLGPIIILRYELSSPARTLGSWVRISLEACMSVCVYSVFVLFCV
jgi:hypothetical protein